MSDEVTAADMEKLLKEAPKWKNGEIPNLDHDTAYDFVKYDWPKILSYVRRLEKQKDELLSLVKSTAQGALVHSDKNNVLRASNDGLEKKLKIATEALEEVTAWNKEDPALESCRLALSQMKSV